MPELPGLNKFALSLNIDVQRHELSSDDMLKFIEHVQQQKASQPSVAVSLTDYVKNTFYSGQDNLVVVPDFSGVTIGKTVMYDAEKLKSAFEQDQASGMVDPGSQQEKEFLKNIKNYIDEKRQKSLDLSGVDFSGCRMEGARFESCDLTGVDARDADFGQVVFKDCIAKGLDLRGSDTSGLEFIDLNLTEIFDDQGIPIRPISEGALLEYQNNNRYVDMHFSTSESMLHRYAEDNEHIEAEAEHLFYKNRDALIKEKQEFIEKSEQEIAKAYGQVSTYEAWISGGKSWDKYSDIKELEKEKISKLKKDITELGEQEFGDEERSKIKYVVHPSVIDNLLIVDDLAQNKYDPAYRRGSAKENSDEPVQYVRLTRSDAEKYLSLCKNMPDLPLNEFAKSQMKAKNIQEIEGARVVADFSVYMEKSNDKSEYAGIAVDLSGLDFSKRNLNGACFVGANMRNCDFAGANLEQATFEGADVSRADFTGAEAQRANFQSAKLQSAIIKDANFSYAHMPHARVYDLKRDQVIESSIEVGRLSIVGSKFNFSNLSNAKLDSSLIISSDFEQADFSGVSFNNAQIRKCKMQQVNLQNAILDGCDMIEVDLSESILKDASARDTLFKKSILEKVDAKNIDLTESEIDALCKLSGAQLDKAIMRKVKADKVSFVGVSMKEADLQYASLKKAVIENVDLQFADFKGAVLDGVKASGVNMSEANLVGISAIGANFKKAQLNNIKAHRADFTESVMESANLRGAKMHDSILEKVNMKKADLREADLSRANFDKAKLNSAKVNDGTDLHHASAESAEGKLCHVDVDGKEKDLNLNEKIEQDNKAHKKKQRSFLKQFAHKAANSVSDFVNRATKAVIAAKKLIRVWSIYTKVKKAFTRIRNGIKSVINMVTAIPRFLGKKTFNLLVPGSSQKTKEQSVPVQEERATDGKDHSQAVAAELAQPISKNDRDVPKVSWQRGELKKRSATNGRGGRG